MSIPNIDFLAKLLTFLGLAISIGSGYYTLGEYNKLKEDEAQMERQSVISQKTGANLMKLVSERFKSADSLVKQKTSILNDILAGTKKLNEMKPELNKLDSEINRADSEFNYAFATKKQFDSLATELDISTELHKRKENIFKRDFNA